MKEIFKSLGQIHGLSWILTIVLDLIWNIPDLVAFCSIYGIPTIPYISAVIFVLCFIIVTLIQRFLSEDEWGKAVLKGLVMGILAAVPFSIVTFVARSIYKGLELVVGKDEKRLFGALGIIWREFENLVIPKAISLGYRPKNGEEDDMERAITYLVKKGVVQSPDNSELNLIRKGYNKTKHVATPSNINELIQQSEKLLDKYRGRLN